MSHDLKRLVTIRALRKDRAERELRREREALQAVQAKLNAERQALVDLELRARAQQESLCDGNRQAGEAAMALNFATAQHLQAKQVRLRMHRASAETAQASKKVDAAHDAWRQRARSHEALKLQEEMLRKKNELLLLTRSEETVAEEHTDAWIARAMAARDAEAGSSR
jgi:hypothetical protein